MQQHGLHAERIGDRAGMLSARPAEAVERVAGDVIAAADGNLLDGVRHVLDRDAQEAVGDFLRAAAGGPGKRSELLAHDGVVEPLVARGSEDRGEEFRSQLADHHIGVGHRKRSAAPVAGRSRICPGAVGSGLEASVLEMQDRAAARGHGMDAHHRRAHPHARDFRLEGALQFAVVMANIGGGAAHVEADDLVEAGDARRLHRADDAARGTGEDCVLALEKIGRRQSAGRHHEHELGAVTPLPRKGGVGRDAQILGDLSNITRQDRREVGIDYRRVAAPDQLDQRRDLVADRDLRETGSPGEPRRELFMPGIFP